MEGRLHRFVGERPLPDDPSRTATVTVDDAATFTGQLAGGGFAAFEVSRVATGHKNGLRIEINGTLGSLRFDLEQFNDLWFYDATEPDRTAGFRRILVTEPTHPYLGNWYPPGHVIGWDTTFVHEIGDLIGAIAAGTDPQPGFDDGLAVQQVIEAVLDQRRDRRPGHPCVDPLIPPPKGFLMSRPVTLFTGQWADLPFAEVCRLAADWGYDGLEIGFGGDHLDAHLALTDPTI